MAEGEFRLGRRDLIIAGAGLVVGSVSKALVDKYTPVVTAGEHEDPLFARTERYPILVAKGVKLRTEPRIPPSSRFYSRSNTIPWEDIAAVNNVSLGGKEAFVVLDASIVYGQQVGSESRDNTWGVVEVAQRSTHKLRDVYFSTLYSPFVRHLSDYTPVSNQSFSRIAVPTSKETAVREILPSIWAKDIQAKFNGEIPLEKDVTYYPGERIYDSVAVVPAGMDKTDRIKNANTPVNVRDFPDTSYNGGEPVSTYGTLAVGSIINNVLLTRGSSWGAFRYSDLQGDLQGVEGKIVRLDPNTICAISASYILTTDKSITE